MHIQFDREDPNSVAGFTFDNNELDQEQLSDFLSWLETINLKYNKLKLRTGQSNEKITCIIINNVNESPKKSITNVTVPQKVPIIEAVPETIIQVSDTRDEDEEYESDSDVDSDKIIKTKKTTKKVVKK